MQPRGGVDRRRRPGEAAAGAGEHGEGSGDLGADRVDGADVEAVGVVEEVPTELAVAGEDGTGQSAQPGLEVVLGWGWFGCGCGELVLNRRFGGLRCDLGLRGGKMGEHAVAHLGGGFVGEGDGEDLLGLLTESSARSLRKR